MERDVMILYIISVISLGFALYNCIFFLIKRKKTNKVMGTIIDIKLPNPETAKARNSKWAKVTYKVNGQNYVSKNRIQVSMSSCIGTKILVRYDIEQPEKLYSFSALRIIVASLVSAFCLVIALFI